MAEAVALAALGWVASPLVQMLIDKGFELLGTSVDEKREILAATALPRLCLAIEKAERSPKKYMLEAWLKRLKNAYYQAEDAIDLLEYQQLDLKAPARNRSGCCVSSYNLVIANFLGSKVQGETIVVECGMS
ncbi:hypothetical protein LUZ63_018934 [Rhynchospora breviuscula]|uniref:Disease resistance N-terminal domain-containing protein n=1 Tax=Rhynchospora breviuscula TaxID=2022672 RepID=A0A9Q0C5F8_9POAL|nr:hypothetical protein LUZ63_018934 [Rhynchospora breviuscula]